MKYAIRANMVQPAKDFTLVNKEFDVYEFTSIGGYKAKVMGEEVFDTEAEALHFLIEDLGYALNSAKQRLQEVEK